MPLIESIHDGHVLTFDEDKHRYTLDGQRVPGPTTFGKGGYPTSEMLIGWMVGQGSKYTAEQLYKLIQENKELPNDTRLKEIIKESKTAYRAVAQAAADIGTVVHDYAYLTELGRTREALQLLSAHENTPAWEKINNGVKKFEAWKGEHLSDEIIASEAIVGSVEESYGGKFDRLAYRPGVGLVLSDFKTSSGIYVDMFIQLGAYVKAIDEWMEKKVDAMEILRFGKEDGEFQTLMIHSKEEMEAFVRQAIFCRRTYKFRLKWESDKRFKWMGRAT